MNKQMLTKVNKVTTYLLQNWFFLILGVLIMYVFFVPEVFANLNTLETKVKGRVTDVTTIVGNIAKACAALGFGYFIFTFLKGEPNYRYAGSLIVGGCLIALASYITTWILA